MVRFGLFGCGRIGRMHADTIAAHPRAELRMVYDVVPAAAEAVAGRHGCVAATEVDQLLESGEVDAVLIASSTDTHVDLITRSAKAGKAILCEKPIDLDIARVDACRDEIAPHKPILQLGFNRRFDPSFKAVQAGLAQGEIGKLELLVITSRDPGPPPAAYIKVSGGLFRDMMIHDFDLARFMLGEDPVAVSAMASVLVEPEIGRLGDVDSAMVTMKAASGALVHINCSRRAVYGYDQRLEAFGERGMLQVDNRRATTVRRYAADGTDTRDSLLDFFIERYAEAYTAELDAFIDAIEKGTPVPVGFEDGRRALILADAALQALKTGTTIDLKWE
ncbi:inositol 2-dehydrogenase [Geminicoccus roseus]|uniref:inositol 2-dehydrogenase n=1 Tax=Geminicoccus roseus TaxID=404900 RepID=UPI0004187C2E|nr:inositol 2-dehydrogenase [Geminicoccus roseus]